MAKRKKPAARRPRKAATRTRETTRRPLPRWAWILPAIVAVWVIGLVIVLLALGDDDEADLLASGSPTPSAAVTAAPTTAATTAPAVSPGTAAASPTVAPTAAATSTPGVARRSAFVHTATPANTGHNYTEIDHADSNGQPNKLVFITHNRGGGGVYHDRSLGVWYTGSRWAIFNQTRSSTLFEGASFNVHVRSPSSTAFVHEATTANTDGFYTEIDRSVTNGKSDAVLIVTQTFNPGGGDGVYNDAPIAVWYTGGKWRIYNQDRSALPLGARFNVLVLPRASSSFVHRAAAENTDGNVTGISSSATNDKPNALVFVTQRWERTTDGENIGVYRTPGTPVRWQIFYEDSGSAVTAGASFNVHVL